MDHIRLPEPKVRSSELPSSPYKLPIVETRLLRKPIHTPSVDFFYVLENRRSRREFVALSENRLSDLLWHLFRVQHQGVSGESFRPVPSAGAKHPLNIFIVVEAPVGLMVYDGDDHALATLDVNTSGVLEILAIKRSLLGDCGGTTLIHAAEFGRTLAKYEFGESLVWRDAGALVASTYFVCEALRINCCAMGHTFDSAVSRALRTEIITGVGGCCIGERAR